MKTIKKLLVSQEDDEDSILKRIEELKEADIDCEFYTFPKKFWSMSEYKTFLIKTDPSISHNDSKATLGGKNVYMISPVKKI